MNRPDEQWKYSYVAGVVDYGSNLQVSVESRNDAAIGYRITPSMYVSNTDKVALGFLDEFCENHGIQPRLRETDTSYRLYISRRDDLQHFLQLIQPYVIARAEAVNIMIDDLIPGLKEGKQSERRDFLDLMEYVDQIREHLTTRGDPKYTEDYFRDEWGV